MTEKEPEQHYNNNKDKTIFKPSAVFQNVKNERDFEKKHVKRWEYYENEDYFGELIGKTVKIAILNQPLFIGIIREFRKYFIKCENPDGKTLYINKAFIITIEPIGVKP